MRDTAKRKTGRTPIWRAIARTLRADIANGQYNAGDKIPTEAQLAERFGVNRHTVRHAISKLVEDGLIRTRRGAGAFVANTPTDYAIGQRVRFHENLLAAGRRPERQVFQIITRAATKGEAAALEIATGEQVCTYHGLSLSDGQPIALFESVFPSQRLVGIEAALEHNQSVSEALKAVGVTDFVRTSTRLTAQLSSATEALHLHIKEGDPVLRSTGVNVDPDGTPVEYGRTLFAGDRVTLTLES